MAIFSAELERGGGRGLFPGIIAAVAARPEPRRRLQLVVVVAATAITQGEEHANMARLT